MNDNNALVSRQASPSSAPVAMQAQTDALERRAKFIAAQGDMLPERYRNNVGACLLAVDWSERNNVSILETLGYVAFVHGKPVVEARLQKRMARERGYTTRLVESTTEHATVAVHGLDGKQIGEPVTYTWELAQEYGIHVKSTNPKSRVYNVVKDAWSTPQKRKHMLVLRATTRALDYYGDGTFGEVDEDTFEPVAAPNSDSEALEAEVVAHTADEAPQADSEPAPPSEDELRALAKQHKLTLTQVLKTAQQMYPEDGLTTMEALAAHPQAAFDLEDWIRQQ